MVRKIPGGKGGTIHVLEKGETANPNGQPRKLFRTVNAELKAKGIEELTKSQLIEAYSLIFNTDQEELERIKKDTTYPLVLRLIITELGDKKARSKALADYRDYMFGKAKQEIDNNHKVTEYTFESNLES